MYSQDIKNLEQGGTNWIFLNEYEQEDEQAHFFFKKGGYYYDAFLYTLESEYLGNVYQDAFEQLRSTNPDATEETVEADPNLQDQLDQYLSELSKESEYEIQEFIAEEADEEDERIIHLDICLNIPEVNKPAIEDFVKKFKANELELDKTYYRFEV